MGVILTVEIDTRDRIFRWKPYKLIFHLFWHFWGKKIILPFLAKNHFFLLILKKGLVIFPQNCLVATATGSGATKFVSVAVNGLRKAEPQLQLQQTHAKFVPVAVAVMPRYFTETINCNRGTLCSALPCCSCSLYKKSYKPNKILVEKSLFLPFPSLILQFLIT